MSCPDFSLLYCSCKFVSIVVLLSCLLTFKNESTLLPVLALTAVINFTQVSVRAPQQLIQNALARLITGTHHPCVCLPALAPC